jgi:hypothetical protein
MIKSTKSNYRYFYNLIIDALSLLCLFEIGLIITPLFDIYIIAILYPIYGILIFIAIQRHYFKLRPGGDPQNKILKNFIATHPNCKENAQKYDAEDDYGIPMRSYKAKNSDTNSKIKP